MDDQKLIKLIKSADQCACEHIEIESPKRVLDSLNALRSRRKSRGRIAGGVAVAGLCCLLSLAVPSLSHVFQPNRTNQKTGENIAVQVPATSVGPADLVSDESLVAGSSLDDWREYENLLATKRRFENELRELDAMASEQERLLAREVVSRSIESSELNWKLTF